VAVKAAAPKVTGVRQFERTGRIDSGANPWRGESQERNRGEINPEGWVGSKASRGCKTLRAHRLVAMEGAKNTRLHLVGKTLKGRNLGRWLVTAACHAIRLEGLDAGEEASGASRSLWSNSEGEAKSERG
jgi:hypothetical protein